MNKILIQAPKIMTKVVMLITWICSSQERERENLDHGLELICEPKMVVLSMVLYFIIIEKWVHRVNVHLRPTYLTSLTHGECYMILNIKDPLASWGATSSTMNTWERLLSHRGILQGHQMSQNVWCLSKHNMTKDQVNKAWACDYNVFGFLSLWVRCGFLLEHFTWTLDVLEHSMSQKLFPFTHARLLFGTYIIPCVQAM